MISKSSHIYKKLLDESLINTASFSCEHFKAPYVSSIIFSGESKNPRKVYDILKFEIQKLKKTGIYKDAFERAKKTIYSRCVSAFDSISGIANSLLECSFVGQEIFNNIDLVSKASLDGINKKLVTLFDDDKSALSIVEPNE